MNCLGNIESSPNLNVHQWFNEWFSLIFIPWVFIYLSKVTYLLSSLINDKHRCLVLTQFLTCIVFNVHIYLKNFKVLRIKICWNVEVNFYNFKRKIAEVKCKDCWLLKGDLQESFFVFIFGQVILPLIWKLFLIGLVLCIDCLCLLSLNDRELTKLLMIYPLGYYPSNPALSPALLEIFIRVLSLDRGHDLRKLITLAISSGKLLFIYLGCYHLD